MDLLQVQYQVAAIKNQSSSAVQPDELCHVMIVNFSDDRESFTRCHSFFCQLGWAGIALRQEGYQVDLQQLLGFTNNGIKCNQCNGNSKPDIGR